MDVVTQHVEKLGVDVERVRRHASHLDKTDTAKRKPAAETSANRTPVDDEGDAGADSDVDSGGREIRSAPAADTPEQAPVDAPAPSIHHDTGISSDSRPLLATGASITTTGEPSAPPVQPVRNALRGFLGLFGYRPDASSPGAPTTPNPLLDLVWAAYRRVESAIGNDTPTAVSGRPQINTVSTDGTTVEGALDLSFTDANGDALTYTAASDNGTVEYDSTSGLFTAHLEDPTRPANITVTASDADAGFHLHGLAGLAGGGHTATSQTYQINVVWGPDTSGPNNAPAILDHGDGWIRVSDPDGDTITPGLSTVPTYGTVTIDSFAPVDGQDGVYQLNYSYSALSGLGALYAYSDDPSSDTFTFNFTDGTDTTTAESVTVVIDPAVGYGSLPAPATTSPIGPRVTDLDNQVVYQTVWDESTASTYVIIARPDRTTAAAVRLDGTATAAPVLDPTTGNVYQTTVVTGDNTSTVVVTVIDADGNIVAAHDIEGIAGIAGAPAAQVVIHDGKAYQTVVAIPAASTGSAEPSVLQVSARTTVTAAPPTGGQVVVIDLADPTGAPVVIDIPGMPSTVRVVNGTPYTLSTVIDTTSANPVVETYVTVLNSADPNNWTRSGALPGMDAGALGGTSQSGVVAGNPYVVTTDPFTYQSYVTVVDLNNPGAAVPVALPGYLVASRPLGDRILATSIVVNSSSTLDTITTVIDADGTAAATPAAPGTFASQTVMNGRVYSWVVGQQGQSRLVVFDPAAPAAATSLLLPAGYSAHKYLVVDEKLVFQGMDPSTGTIEFVVVNTATESVSDPLAVRGGLPLSVTAYGGDVYVVTAGLLDPTDLESGFATWVTRVETDDLYTASIVLSGEYPAGTPIVEDGTAYLLTSRYDDSEIYNLWKVNFSQLSFEQLDNGPESGTDLDENSYAAPATAAQLYRHLRDVTSGEGDGMYVEVVGTDDGPRYIVYFGGTTDAWFNGNQPITDNIPAYNETIKPEHLARLRALQRDNPDVPMMLVGYSQGGLDAQNISASGEFKVTAVVTYGAPVIRESGDYAVIHLRAEDDPIPPLSKGAPLATAYARNEVFTSRVPWRSDFWSYAGDPFGIALHGDVNTYQWVGSKFETDPGFDAVKEEMAKYHGTVYRTYGSIDPGQF